MRSAGATAERAERLAPALLALALIAVTAHAGGAYVPSAWGWSALGPLIGATAAVSLLERFEYGPADVAWGGALTMLVLWTALSVSWSDSVPRTVSEVERDLVYLSAVGALLVLSTGRPVGELSGGVVAAVTGVCGYGLLTRLFPDRFGLEIGLDYRLSTPIGYWNALGIVAAMGVLLALGVAASARRPAARALAASAAVILVCTLYFTFSRGAWASLALGLVVALAIDPHRARLAATTASLAPLLAAAVWASSRSRWLNDAQAVRDAAARDGHRLALILGVLALACAAVPLLLQRLRPRIQVPRAFWIAASTSVACVLVALAVVGLVRVGGPEALWGRVSDGFRASPYTSDPNLSHRLFTISGHSRADYWRVAWSEASSHPWLGSGAGTYDLYWTRDRPLPVGALDAHNLYLETLAELGPLGLALLAAFLATPLVALRRARRHPGVPAAAGAYVAFLISAGADWHWELPTVTLVALCCGTVVVVAARGPDSSRPIAARARIVALAALAAALAVALVGHVGNQAIAVSQRESVAGRYDEAAAAARR
ncbi:MAG: O-antigen ligase family protein, partial [Gaiellaceae bacterium]